MNNIKTNIPNKKTKKLVILSPGIMGGQKNILIEKFSKKLLKNNIGVVTWDFNFFLNGEEKINPVKEIKELKNIIRKISKEYPEVEIHLAGKSYGGLISSLVMDENIKSLSVFGLLINFKGLDFKKPEKKDFFVVHGTKDGFFKTKEISEYLKNESNLFTVEEADHGLNDSNSNFIGDEGLKWCVERIEGVGE
jgi:predicted alpha/beta-hydrolase family hydrolase